MENFLIYSPDECGWYWERRIPGHWAISQLFKTKSAAEKAMIENKIKWEAR